MNESKPAKNDKQFLDRLYQETCTLLRFYLTWRQLLLGGFFAVIGALSLGYKWSLDEAGCISFVFPFAGAIVGLLFWALDQRNRELYTIAADAGRKIEDEMVSKKVGYCRVYESGQKHFSHSVILKIFYIGFSVLMIAVGITHLMFGELCELVIFFLNLFSF